MKYIKITEEFFLATLGSFAADQASKFFVLKLCMPYSLNRFGIGGVGAKYPKLLRATRIVQPFPTFTRKWAKGNVADLEILVGFVTFAIGLFTF